MRWEYHIERFGTLLSEDATLRRIEIALYRQFSSDLGGIVGLDRCMELGRNGWVLVTIFPDEGYLVGVFKRPVAKSTQLAI
jgi:hypothetical protein